MKIQKLLNSIKGNEEKEPASIQNTMHFDSIYLGESLRFTDRLNDHEGNVRRYEHKKSTVARHVTRNKGRTIDWELIITIDHLR